MMHGVRISDRVRIPNLLSIIRRHRQPLDDVRALHGADRDRLSADVARSAGERRYVEARRELEIGAANRVPGELERVAVIEDLADILELRARETERRCLLDGYQGADRLRRVIRVRDTDAAVEGAGVESDFDFSRALRSQIGIADGSGRERRLA